jgi:hypothetical protein
MRIADDVGNSWRERNVVANSSSTPFYVTKSTVSTSTSTSTSFDKSSFNISNIEIEKSPVMERGWTPEKDPNPDIDWNPFDDDNNNGLAAAITSWHPFPFADKVEVGVSQVRALVSPVGVNDIDSFTRKRFNEKSVTAAGTLFNDSSREDADDEGTLDEGTLPTSFYEDTSETSTLDEGTLTTDGDALNEGIDDEGTLLTSFDEDYTTGTVGRSALTTDFNTIDEGTGSCNAGSEVECEDGGMSLESELDSIQGKSGIITKIITSIFEELMGTYEDTNNAFSQVLNGCYVSPDDIDEMTDVIHDVKEDLKMSHTDEFIRSSKHGWLTQSS